MKKLRKIYLEITNICNLNCNFCPKTARPPHQMSLEEFSVIADKVASHANNFFLHVMGEPLLHPHLPQILEICYQNQMRITITTNGTLLAKMGDILLSSPAVHRVNISLHSFEANESDISMKQYLSEVIHFAKQAAQKGKYCFLRLWNMDSKEIRASNSYNVSIISTLKTALGTSELDMEKLLCGDAVSLDQNIYLEMAKKFEWPDLSCEQKEQQIFCYGLRNQIAVLCDGTVVPCCLDHEGDLALGNLFTQSLDEIRCSDRAQAIFNGFSNRTAVEELCRRCEYATRF